MSAQYLLVLLFMGYAESVPADATAYRRRQPKESPLWHLIDQHFADFERDYEQRFAGKFGFLRRVISDVVNRYHTCGDRMWLQSIAFH